MDTLEKVNAILLAMAEGQARFAKESEARAVAFDARFEQRMAAFDARFEKERKKADAEMAKIRRLSAKIKENQAKTDAQLAKTDAQLAKTDAQLAKTDAQLAKTDAKLQETAHILGNLGVNIGQASEEFFYYALLDNKQMGGITFDYIELYVKSRTKKLQDEFDIVLYNGNSIGIVEIKHKVHPNDLEKLTTKKVENFRLLFPDYADYNVYLGIGGMSIPGEVAEQARAKGVAVFRQKGAVMELDDANLQVF